MENKKNSKSKLNFILGALSGVGVMFVIGFFILLSMFLGGGDSGSYNNPVAQGNNNPSVKTNTPPANNDIVVEPVNKDDHIKGDENAPISIVEFSDTECPFCKRFHSTMKQVVEAYDGQVNWIYRHFPLTSLHSKAPKEAEATECAGELAGNDGFWAYIDRLFEITPANNGLQESQLYDIAQDVGLDANDFRECLNSGKYASKVRDHASQAQRAGGTGTPYSILIAGDEKIPFSGALPFEQLKTVIDSILQ